MRQLKGGKTKESSKERRERKQENRKMKQKFWSIGLPVLMLITGLIVAYIYLNTRPRKKY